MSSKTRPKMLATTTVGEKRFEVCKKLGEGCFGEVFQGVDTRTSKKVAIKFEEAMLSDTLKNEADLLELLRRPFQRQGFMEVLYCGTEGPYTCMVMELLGMSVEDTVVIQGGSFDTRTTANTGNQALLRLEYLHSKGIVHRDIKPENFMWGVGRKTHHLYLIDFGLSVKYYDRKHSNMGTGQSLTGTARYASISAHKGYTQSRRDDLEAVGHMLFYFLRGKLPWSGLKAKTDQEKFQRIQEKKEQFPILDLCKGHPNEFAAYLKYTRELTFKERPDYDSLRKLFQQAREKEGRIEDDAFPWLIKEGAQLEDLVPIETHNQACRQPDDGPKAKGGFLCCFGSSSVAQKPPRMSIQSLVPTRALDTE